MEKYSPSPESPGLYRERVTSEGYSERLLKKIDGALKGEDVLDLSETERTEILTYEDSLGERLETIDKKVVRSISLYQSYLLTEEGRILFSEITGLSDIPGDPESLQIFLYQNTEVIGQLTLDKRKGLKEKCNDYQNKMALEQLESHIDENGELNIGDIDLGEATHITLDPDKLLQKLEELRKMKSDLKDELKGLACKEKATDKEKAHAIIIQMYLKRINLAIALTYGYQRSIQTKAESIGIDALSDSERNIIRLHGNDSSEINRFKGNSQIQREQNASRIDKFIYGASLDYTDDEPAGAGWRKQVGVELLEFAEKRNKENNDGIIHRDEILRDRGLNPELVMGNSVTPKQRSTRIKELLRRQELLSSKSKINDEAPGPPPDRRWQVDLRPGRMTAAVIPKRQVMIVPYQRANIVTDLTIDLAHEPCHVIQNENKKNIPMRLFRRLGAGRADTFSELGAMAIQEEFSREIFGFGVIDHPQSRYIKGMLKRFEGGNYLDIIKSFYDDEMEPYIQMRNEGQIGNNEFNERKKRAIWGAYTFGSRIFRGGSLQSSRSAFLTNSKDTAYLEQLLLREKLKSRGLDFLLYVGGVNLETCYDLIRLGLLNPNGIKKPDLSYPRELWFKEKSKYELKPQNDSKKV